MSKKKEIKALCEAIAGLKLEIAEMRETAQQNASMLAEKIEKLSAADTEKTKPAERNRKPRMQTPAKEQAAAKPKQKAAPVKKEKTEPEKKTPPVKKAAASRAPRVTSTLTLYNCDENKSPESMFNKGDEVFRNTQAGRRALWNKLKKEIDEGRIAVLDGYPMKNLRLEIADGNAVTANKYLKFGFIEKKD